MDGWRPPLAAQRCSRESKGVILWPGRGRTELKEALGPKGQVRALDGGLHRLHPADRGPHATEARGHRSPEGRGARVGVQPKGHARCVFGARVAHHAAGTTPLAQAAPRAALEPLRDARGVVAAEQRGGGLLQPVRHQVSVVPLARLDRSEARDQPACQVADGAGLDQPVLPLGSQLQEEHAGEAYHRVGIGGHAPEAGGYVWVLEDELDDVCRGRDGARGGLPQRDGDGVLVCEPSEDMAEEVELREVVVNEGILDWKLANRRGATCEQDSS